MAKPLINKTKSGIPAQELNLALAEATKCGYGIDPIKGFIALPNFNSISGDVDGIYGLYVVNGSIEIGPIAEVKAAVNAYCNNSIVSATGVTISGCLTGTPLDFGGSRQLTATVLPAGASQAGTWVSSNPEVATVSPTGLVENVGDGGFGVTFTFTSTDGGYTASCLIMIDEE